MTTLKINIKRLTLTFQDHFIKETLLLINLYLLLRPSMTNLLKHNLLLTPINIATITLFYLTLLLLARSFSWSTALLSFLNLYNFISRDNSASKKKNHPPFISNKSIRRAKFLNLKPLPLYLLL